MAKKVSKVGTFKVNKDASATYSNQKHKPLVAREYKITTYSDGTFKVTDGGGSGGSGTKKRLTKSVKKKTSRRRVIRHRRK